MKFRFRQISKIYSVNLAKYEISNSTSLQAEAKTIKKVEKDNSEFIAKNVQRKLLLFYSNIYSWNILYTIMCCEDCDNVHTHGGWCKIQCKGWAARGLLQPWRLAHWVGG